MVSIVLFEIVADARADADNRSGAPPVMLRISTVKSPVVPESFKILNDKEFNVPETPTVNDWATPVKASPF